jgi:hypothetical protein
LRYFTRAQRGFVSQHSPLIVDVGANVRHLFHPCAFLQRAAIVLAILKRLECFGISPLRKVGYFSLVALSLGCRVMAFEPSAHMMPCAPLPLPAARVAARLQIAFLILALTTLIEMSHVAARAVSHAPCSFIRASLAMNADSFVDRFSAIQCAAGSAFEAVDLNIESRNDELIWEMTSLSTSQSQDEPDDDHGNRPFKCRNCRLSPLSPSSPRSTPPRLTVGSFGMQSHRAT